MKKLFILSADNGDGSIGLHYTFNEEWIRLMENSDLEYGDIGVDGDGFHYDTLMLPDECTLESLGIYNDVAD